jgi:hypothetical protein
VLETMFFADEVRNPKEEIGGGQEGRRLTHVTRTKRASPRPAGARRGRGTRRPSPRA